MRDISDRIKEKRSEFKYTLRGLGNALKLTHSTVQQWENGTAEPSGKNLILLAEVFKTSPEWLREGINNKEIHRSGYKKTKLIKYYNSEKTGIIPNEMIGDRKLNNINLYTMNGDSMYPLINRKSTIAIDLQEKKIEEGS